MNQSESIQVTGISMSTDPKIYRQKAQIATIVALSVNTILGCLKIVTGFITFSISLIADGFDSLMDLLMGIFAYLGTIIAQKPADEDHHYGHEKIEMIFLLMIIGVILVTGIGILLQALERFIWGIILSFSLIALLVTIISIFGKIFIAFFVYNISKQINSSSLRATSFNYLTDVFSSILVLIAIVTAYFNFGLIDSIAAAIICLFIVYTGVQMLREVLYILIDRAPNKEDLEAIYNYAMSVDNVKEAHKLRARTISNKIVGDMHILVDPELSVRQGHAISETVSDLIERKTGAKIIIHLEPFER